MAMVQQGPTEPAGERHIALVLHDWGHASTFFSWTWTKQYLLRRTPDGHLAPQEKLFIVKAGKDEREDREKWKVGGPLVPDLETAMKNYPHSVVRLEGRLRDQVPTFLQDNDVDIMVVPDHWPQSMLQLTSVSDWVRQALHRPFIIIRRTAVVNARMKISSQAGGGKGGPGSPTELSRMSVCTAAATGRRIAVVYNSFAVGRGLMQFAKDKLLTHADTVYICHVFSSHNPVVKEAVKVVRVLTLQRAESASDEVTRDNSLDFGAAELAGFNLQLGVALQGDPKSAIPAFCEAEEIELLVMGTRSGGKIRRKLSGGSVSSHLIDNAPCPCLVVPYRYMGLDEGRETVDEEMEHGLSTTSAVPSVIGGGSPRVGDAAAAAAAAAAASSAAAAAAPDPLVAQLQRELAEKDRLIAELRQQVARLQLEAGRESMHSARSEAEPGGGTGA